VGAGYEYGVPHHADGKMGAGYRHGGVALCRQGGCRTRAWEMPPDMDGEVGAGYRHGGAHHVEKVGAGCRHWGCSRHGDNELGARWVQVWGAPSCRQGGCRTRAWEMPPDMDGEVGAGYGHGGAHHADKVGAGYGHRFDPAVGTTRWVQDMGVEDAL